MLHCEKGGGSVSWVTKLLDSVAAFATNYFPRIITNGAHAPVSAVYGEW
jgi:hypothetical protein